MKFLRTVSTRRLLAMMAGLIAAIAAGTAIALAAAGRGPVPPPSSLAQALHRAATAPAVSGISARISFTNHLISTTNIQGPQGSDPILTGATGRLWLSSDHRLRLELQANNGDAQVVIGNGSFWISDPSANTVYEGKLPAQTGAAKDSAKQNAVPSIAQIQSQLKQMVAHLDLSGAIPSDVAHHAAYTVQVSPKHDGGLLGSAQLAWDAARGVPLRIAVYARNNSSPVLELKATDISYGAVPASVFKISPPSGDKIVKISTPPSGSAEKASRHGAKAKSKSRAQVSGVAAVARHLPFTLRAPSHLVGLPRRGVSLLDWGGSPAALVSYGENLGGVAVIEQTASSASAASKSQSSSQDHGGGLSLPTVSINGASGQELDTALGTLVRFTRKGVTYTVVGSVPATAADAAARQL